MSYLKETPLGRSTDYVDEYTPSLLCPVPRWDARESLELEELGDEDTSLPFHGTDIWNAYELSWLNEKGKPVVALCELRIPCNTPNIVFPHAGGGSAEIAKPQYLVRGAGGAAL